MSEVTVEGKILRWGNSYGIRITKDDVEGSDLHPGEEVVVRIEHRQDRLDLSGLPTFASGHESTSERHDAALGEARSVGHLETPGEEADRVNSEEADGS